MVPIDIPQANVISYYSDLAAQTRRYSGFAKPTNTLGVRLLVSPNVKEALLENFKSKLQSLTQLKDNWDGYSASQPSKRAIRQASVFLVGLPLKVLQYLDEEDIVPTPYGTIVIDLYRGKNRLSLEFGESKVGFFSEFMNQNIESEGVKLDRTKLPYELEKAISLFLQA